MTKAERRRYYLKHREEIKERVARYKKENKEAVNASTRAWTHKNQEAYRAIYTKRNHKRSDAIKGIRGGACHICESTKGMVTHHIDPGSREFLVSQASSAAKAREEAKKTVTLCRSCHAKVHLKMRWHGAHPLGALYAVAGIA